MAEKQGNESEVILDAIVTTPYKYGFKTDIDIEEFEKGLSLETVKKISRKKDEPSFLLNFREKAFKNWTKMVSPEWASLELPKINYDNIQYYSIPKTKKKLGSLDEADPELLKTFEKLGVSLNEQKMLTNVAVDAVFDSVSIGTTFKKQLQKFGVIFCSISEAIKTYPELVERYLGRVVPIGDNYFSALNSAVFSDGSFCYIPKDIVCPMELSTYFRINNEEAGQFERTLIIAEERSSISYLEGCTAPKFSTNQLHAAVVELVALDNAVIKYSTVQNWYAGDEKGIGGVFNFVTKRGLCSGKNARISWTQVETGSSITWKYPSCVLSGQNSVGEFFSVALTSNKRSVLLPNVPTVAELGYKDFDYRLWYAFISKSGTQAPILARLSNEIKAVTDLPEIQEKMKMQGLEPTHIQLADFDKYIASEIVKLGRIVKASGIKPD